MVLYDSNTTYRRQRYYNPKVHVDGWYDIQNDEQYIQKYNELKKIDLQYYPNLPINDAYKNNSTGNLKNKSAKEVIFYQKDGAESWITENQASFTCNNKF